MSVFIKEIKLKKKEKIINPQGLKKLNIKLSKSDQNDD
jgi:hypothetical protein